MEMGGSKLRHSMRLSVMGIQEEEHPQQQQIHDGMAFHDVITARESYEFSFGRARRMVLLNVEQFTSMK